MFKQHRVSADLTVTALAALCEGDNKGASAALAALSRPENREDLADFLTEVSRANTFALASSTGAIERAMADMDKDDDLEESGDDDDLEVMLDDINDDADDEEDESQDDKAEESKAELVARNLAALQKKS